MGYDPLVHVLQLAEREPLEGFHLQARDDTGGGTAEKVSALAAALFRVETRSARDIRYRFHEAAVTVNFAGGELGGNQICVAFDFEGAVG
ncbi:MAG: hypothetical protein OXI39_11040 [Gemmatimonadota bacterium]|uniref:hypothetical protein n=1 Tax=Candidatus Palauibacter scopulicola TaxID=3056741 RepID=UPI0023A56D07|nr:hypothetical protein [Candidatus Palauibacter scopulicola]MDE2663522.1 hypothetical protein [Candidatus Palauibacter scopulicola]